MNGLIDSGNKPAAEGFILANEADRGVQSDPVEPCTSMRLLPQAGQRAPDLEQHLLIQIFLISAAPGVNTADLQKLGPVLTDQLQKSLIVVVQCGVQGFLL